MSGGISESKTLPVNGCCCLHIGKYANARNHSTSPHFPGTSLGFFLFTRQLKGHHSPTYDF